MPTQKILFSYISYLALFLGTGFISGAIVHSGNFDQIPKNLIIGAIGVALFIAGSFAQEFLLNKENFDKGVVRLFFFSVLLSIGIGMISGGTQHFTDFPVYSSYLIPLGLILSLVAFLLKNNYKLQPKIWSTLIIGSVIISTTAHFGLMVYANSWTVKSAKDCTPISAFGNIKAQANGDHDNKCKTTKLTVSKPNSNIITNDKTFIEYVIPHHQDAVKSSQDLLKTTQDPELKSFLENVISTQSQEITLLKGYYKTWFNADYTESGSYMAMMKPTGATGLAADKEYIKGMLSHHSGIIDIAKKVLTDSKLQYKQEILALSKKIIQDQEADNLILKNWLETKYKSITTDKEAEFGHSH